MDTLTARIGKYNPHDGQRTPCHRLNVYFKESHKDILTSILGPGLSFYPEITENGLRLWSVASERRGEVIRSIAPPTASREEMATSLQDTTFKEVRQAPEFKLAEVPLRINKAKGYVFIKWPDRREVPKKVRGRGLKNKPVPYYKLMEVQTIAPSIPVNTERADQPDPRPIEEIMEEMEAALSMLNDTMERIRSKGWIVRVTGDVRLRAELEYQSPKSGS